MAAPTRRCSQSSPSTPTYTTPEPSASQSKHPPPIPRPGRGSGDVVSIRSGPPPTSTIVTADRVPQRCTNATVRPSGESRGSVSSRPARTSSTEMGSTEPARPARGPELIGLDRHGARLDDRDRRVETRLIAVDRDVHTALSPRRRCPMIDPNKPNTTTRPTMSPVARTDCDHRCGPLRRRPDRRLSRARGVRAAHRSTDDHRSAAVRPTPGVAVVLHRAALQRVPIHPRPSPTPQHPTEREHHVPSHCTPSTNWRTSASVTLACVARPSIHVSSAS